VLVYIRLSARSKNLCSAPREGRFRVDVRFRSTGSPADELVGHVLGVVLVVVRFTGLTAFAKPPSPNWSPKALLPSCSIRPASAITAATALAAWSHPGRVRSEAAYASIAGVNPIPTSSGNTICYRRNRGGDRRQIGLLRGEFLPVGDLPPAAFAQGNIADE
jgi:Transposase IS116/IS110/IS902 family